MHKATTIRRMYTPSSFEPKWQQHWVKQHSYKANDADIKPKMYILDMFPYPSANGLHVGHPEGYTATDIVARYQRMQGKNVLHPMGWDAFGLPAENYAIKTGVDPDTSTHQNIKNFTRQIQELGFSYDWDREVDTSSPEYYKWTQWMFLQMYEHGLAYRKKARVNWCNSCQTVLANEQVIDGKCERSKDEVVQKDLEQWFFKTTAYADQLIEDLAAIDWPEPIKLMQKNWIGKSFGTEVDFQVQGATNVITIYTTRVDTIFSGAFIVLAPEHPLVKVITTPAQQSAVNDYVIAASKKNDLERTSLNKEKTGAFTGAYAINPVNQKAIPIWVGDFVLATYGTGAIFGDAHDERDFVMAQKYHIPLTVSVRPVDDTLWEQVKAMSVCYTEDGILVNSGQFDGLTSAQAREQITAWLEEQKKGKKKINYKLRDWLISRQRYWGAPIPIVYDPEGKAHPVKAEHLPLQLPTDVDYLPKGTSPIGTSESYKALAEQLYGKGWHFEVDTMDTFVCSSWYYLRYCDPNNTQEFAAQEKLAKWLPVDLYVGGAEHAVLHLLYARFFHKALQDFGFIPKSVGREPFAALRNQGMILGEDNQKMSKSRGNVINPDDVVKQYGSDTIRLYEMFMGPFADVKPWSTSSIKGVYRFLEKVERLQAKVGEGSLSTDVERLFNQTIKLVGEHIVGFQFNTAISQMMILTNKLSELEVVPTATFKQLLLILSPFAPHLAAELWTAGNYGNNVWEQAWPQYDETKLVSDTVKLIVQVNGKLRDSLEVAQTISEDDAKAQAMQLENVKKHIDGKAVVKIVYVPKRLVNIVVKWKQEIYWSIQPSRRMH